MNSLQIFENQEFGQVRTITIDDEPWFVGKDVAVALGYKNPQEAIREHIDEYDKGVSEILTPGGRQKMPIINESGLYSLIFSSKLESAKQFKHWVTSEVLPTIRKTGTYNSQNIYKIKDTSLGEITSFVREMDKVMRDQDSHPSDIAEAFKDVCEQFGIRLPKNFVKEPMITVQTVQTGGFIPYSVIEEMD